MAYDEELAARIRKCLSKKDKITELKMFGGLCFMIAGNMCCGVIKDNLIVRVGPERYENYLRESYARPMDFTGRALRGFVYVESEGYDTDESLKKWVGRGVEFASSLRPK